MMQSEHRDNLQPWRVRRDPLQLAIERTAAAIRAAFDSTRRFNAKLKDPTDAE